jgi:DNA-binding transcriptional LysR family regulator
MVQPFDWDDLRVFLAVAEAGSQTAAARLLGLTHSTVGRRLKAFEDSAGRMLFERLPNRLELTAFGRDLIETATAMRDAADAVARRVAARSTCERQRVRITATSSVALFLTRNGERLLAECPAAELCVSASRERLSLARREAEIALRMRRLPEAGDLVAKRLGRIAFALYRMPSAASDAFIGLEPSDRLGSQSAWVDGHAAAGRVVLRVADVKLRHEAARAGLGATLLPCFLGDADPGLTRLGPPPPELMEDVYLIVHDDLRELPAIRETTAALTDLFRSRSAGLLGASD